MRATDVHERDLAAFAARQHHRLTGLLTLHCGDRYVGEELAQEALVRLCQHWSRVRTMDEPEAWLTRVALNLATSRFRRYRAERRALLRLPPNRVGADAPDTAEALAVRRAVAALPPRQRTVLILRFFDDLTVAQTAHLMQVAEGTVKSLTAHAVHALRQDVAGALADSYSTPNGR